MAGRAASSRGRFNHAGLTVTDITVAVEWYRRVFGLAVVFGPAEVTGSGRSKIIFGPAFEGMKRAVLSDPSGVAVELFEFIQPASVRRQDNFEYWKTGIFHICFTCEDVAAQIEQIVAAGGRARTEPLPAGDGRFIAYCEDPFGNLLELTNRTVDETYR